MSYILANWCLSNNVGDSLTPYLIEKISGKQCIYATPDSPSLKYVIVGSILNWDIMNAVFWGAGIANITDFVGLKDIRAVRGPISKSRAVNGGNRCEEVPCGDPALLLPKYFYPNVKIKHNTGVFPHYVDIERVMAMSCGKYKVINPLSSVEETVREILSCETIISSSLHGLIIAEAYGRKTQWVKFSEKIGGDGTKFRDHYASIGVDNPSCVFVKSLMEIDGIKPTPKKISPRITENLLQACPFL